MSYVGRMSLLLGRRTSRLGLVMLKLRNPAALLLDYVGLQKQAYVVRGRDGLSFELRPGRGDKGAFSQVILGRAYLKPGVRINEGDTVIDVGANIGCFSVQAGSMVGPSGRVISIEPAESTYKQLVANVAHNRMTHIKPVRAAIGGEAGMVRLYVGDQNSQNASVLDEVDGREMSRAVGVEDVAQTTLADLMRDHGIDRCNVVKMDCEGAEHDVFQRISQQTADRIDQIVMEVHSIKNCQGRRHATESIATRLRALGFETRPTEDGLYAWRRPK